jgi:hypothetical protein
VPAAAAIPAPIAYIKVVAVKKLVVGSRSRGRGPPDGGQPRPTGRHRPGPRDGLRRLSRGAGEFTLKKLECSGQAKNCPDNGAWNNGTGPRFYSVGLRN